MKADRSRTLDAALGRTLLREPSPPQPKPVPIALRSVAFLALVLAAGVAALGVAPARAAAPCWKELINDWFDGHIDKTYPVHCYREALRHLPTDVETYSSARDDISRALASVIAGRGKPPSGGSQSAKPVGKGTPSPRGGAGKETPRGQSSSGGSSGGSGRSGGGSRSQAAGGDKAPGRDKGRGGPVGSVIKEVGPDSADSVPIPLVVLGSLALFLVLLGSAGFVARRLQARRGVRPAADSRPQKP